MKLIALASMLVLATLVSVQADQKPGSQADPSAAEERYNLAAVYHAFMERFADENPAWKTDVTLRADINKPPKPPCRLSYNDTLGYYTYRVKRWDELNDCEKFGVQNDPRLPHFIRELYGRNIPNAACALAGIAAGGGAVSPATTAAASAAVVTPEEISTPDVSPSQKIDLTRQPKGFLSQSEGVFVYKFDPDDLLSAKPIRLIEVAKDQ